MLTALTVKRHNLLSRSQISRISCSLKYSTLQVLALHQAHVFLILSQKGAKNRESLLLWWNAFSFEICKFSWKRCFKKIISRNRMKPYSIVSETMSENLTNFCSAGEDSKALENVSRRKGYSYFRPIFNRISPCCSFSRSHSSLPAPFSMLEIKKQKPMIFFS